MIGSASVRQVRVSAMDMDRITLSLPKDLKKKAQIKAILVGTTLSAVFREFLQEWVKDWPEQGREDDSEG